MLYTLLLIALAFSQVTNPIIQHRGNPQRTGFYAGAAIQQPELLWERDLQMQTGSMLLVDNTLYVDTVPARNQGQILALDSTTGETQWQVDVPGVVIGAMAYADGTLFAGTTQGMIALDALTGAEQWHFRASGAVWGAPLLVENQIFMTGQRGIFALDRISGVESWRIQIETSFLAYDNGELYFLDSNQLVAADPLTGEILWETALGSAHAINLTVVDGIIYSGDDAGHLYAVDQISHEIIWSQAIADAMYWSAPVISGDLLITGNMNQQVYAFNRLTGELIWQVEVADWATSDGIGVGEMIYFGVGTHETDTGASPFYALDAATGEEIWHFDTAGLIHSAPIYAVGRLYISTIDGKLYALGEAP